MLSLQLIDYFLITSYPGKKTLFVNSTIRSWWDLAVRGTEFSISDWGTKERGSFNENLSGGEPTYDKLWYGMKMNNERDTHDWHNWRKRDYQTTDGCLTVENNLSTYVCYRHRELKSKQKQRNMDKIRSIESEITK